MKKPSYSELENRIKHLEKKLKGIELQQLWNVYAQNPIPTFILSKEGNFVEYNDAMAELTGYTHEEVPDVNALMPKIYPDEEYRKKVMEISRKSRHREIKVKRDEFIITRKDGKKRYAEFSVFNIMHEGKPADLQVVQAVEITERKQAEKALWDSEEKYRFLTENLIDGIYEFDLKGKFIYVNKAAAHMFGYSKDEIIGSIRVNDLMVDEDIAVSSKAIGEILKGKTAVGERTFIRKDGIKFIGEIHSGPIYKGKDVVGVRGVIRDITERKQAEEKLREKEEFNYALFDHNPIQTVVVDLEGRITNYNLAKKSSDDRMPEFGDVLYKDYASGHETDMYAELMKCIKTNKVKTFPEQKYGDKVFSITISPFPRGAIVTSIDITERKKAEELLIESEKKYRTLFENANDAIFIADVETGVLLDVNKEAVRLTGRSKKEIIGMHQSQLHPSDKVEHYRERFRRHTQLDRRVDFEAEVIKKDGAAVPVYISAAVMELRGKKVIQGIFRDVTELKKAEEALKESEKRYRASFDNSRDAINIFSKDRKIIGFNKKLIQLSGYSKKELLSMELKDLYPEAATPSTAERIKKMLQGEEIPVFETDLLTKKGEKIPVGIAITMLKNCYGEEFVFQGNIRDITERKKAEKELLFKTALLEAQSETTIDGILVVDPEGKSILFNKHFVEMWSVPQKILKTRDSDKIFPHALSRLKNPEEFLAKVRYLYTHKDEKSMDEIEFKDGRVFDRYTSPLKDSEGKYYGRIWYFRDITERKQAEGALRESEEKYHTLTDNLNVGVFRSTPGTEGKFLEVNPAMVKIFGFENKEEFLDINVSDLYQNPEDRADFDDKMLKYGFLKNQESVSRKKDGTAFTASDTAVAVKDEKGNVLYYDGIVEDITERKKAEEELKESKTHLSNALRIAKLGHWEYDVMKNQFTFTDEFYSIFRTTAEKMGGYTMSPERYTKLFVHPDDLSVVATENQKALETTDPNYSRQLEHKMVYADGSIGYIAVRFRIIKDMEGNTIKTFGVNQDITERKKAEEKIREAKEKAEKYLYISKVMMAAVDADEKITMINKKGCKDLGYKNKELIGENWFDLLVPKNIRKEVRGVFNKLMSGKVKPVEFYENILLTKNGEERLFAFHNTILKDEKSKINGVLFSAEDITERKKAEEERLQREKLSGVLEMAGAASHELTQPMQAIYGYTGLLLSNMPEDDPLSEQITIVVKQIKRMAKITRKLQNITKYETKDYLSGKIIDIDKASKR